jgi:outer membrane receptor protein involved in Fe transport
MQTMVEKVKNNLWGVFMRLSVAAAISCLLLTSLPAAESASAAIVKKTNIPPQGLDSALEEFAHERGLQLIYATDEVGTLRSPGARGDLSAADVLERLLQGTGLSYEFLDDKTVTVEPTATANTDEAMASQSPSAAPSADKSAAVPAESASPQQNSTDQDSASANEQGRRDATSQAVQLDEVVVTGTHIRGTEPVAPVLVFTRGDIEQNGFGTVDDLIKSLPENFNGGASTTTVGSISGGGNAVNSTEATGVNLRGLGNDATLVLLDGHRIAPGNISANFVDISMIPLSAVERVEIVPDGASAIYGSDAVGGVVNFILRKNFSGAETMVREDAVTSGGYRQFEAAQTAGTVWDGGSALLSYEYLDQKPLLAADRSYAHTLEPFDLVPPQIRHGVLLNADQSLAPGVDLFADATYSHRDSLNDYAVTGYQPLVEVIDVDAYTATLGTRVSLPYAMQLELSADYGGSRSHLEEYRLGGTPPSYVAATESSVVSLDAKLDGGVAWGILGGPLRYAVGAQFRRESVDQYYFVPSTEIGFAPSRTVTAAFGELEVPLLGPAEGVSGPGRLDLSLAARAERYSDFGYTTNPKVGLAWRPWPALKLRGTYGTSFVAPELNELNPKLTEAAAEPLPDPKNGGTTDTLLTFGGNAALQPQKATSWTLGADFQPQASAGPRASVSYYNIDYRDRIATLEDTGFSNLFLALVNEATLGPAIVQRNPSLALVQQLESSPVYFNYSGQANPTIGAIVSSRELNLSAVHTSGLDMDLSYKAMFSGLSSLEVGAAGTYILNFDDQFTTYTPKSSVVNTLFNPTHLKLRARTIVQHGGFNGALFLNYVSAYRDNTATGTVPVASWTTLDATFAYDFGKNRGPLSGLVARLGVTNLTNRAPPYIYNVTSAASGIYYDGANANPLGRIVYGQLVKRW